MAAETREGGVWLPADHPHGVGPGVPSSPGEACRKEAAGVTEVRKGCVRVESGNGARVWAWSGTLTDGCPASAQTLRGVTGEPKATESPASLGTGTGPAVCLQRCVLTGLEPGPLGTGATELAVPGRSRVPEAPLQGGSEPGAGVARRLRAAGTEWRAQGEQCLLVPDTQASAGGSSARCPDLSDHPQRGRRTAWGALTCPGGGEADPPP